MCDGVVTGSDPHRAIFVSPFLMETCMCFTTAFSSCSSIWSEAALVDYCGWLRFFPCIFGF